jgi:integrase
LPRKRKPARLYQRKDDKAWIILDAGKHHRTGYGDGCREQAEQALSIYLVEKAITNSEPKSPKHITLGQILALYANGKADEIADPERLRYAIIALAPFWGNLTADMVKTSACKKYGKSRRIAGSTIRRELGVLQAAINYAHREGVLTQIVSVTLPPHGKPKERYLTRSELATLLWFSPKHLRRFIILSIYTGRRKKAVLGLKWKASNKTGWVDLEAGLINFLGTGEIETAKRKGSIRIPPKLLSHLRSWHDPDEPSVITYNSRSIKDVKKAFAIACYKAGIEGATPHTLKHTAVTLGFQSGLTMEDATDYFATTAETLTRVYRQHSPHKNHAALGPMQRLGK